MMLLADENDVKKMTQYIRSAESILANKLGKETDTFDWHLTIKVFKHLDNIFHKHTIVRFASKDNKQLHRYNTKWRDGAAEAVDSLHLADELWRHKVNRCNPP
jgi:hypothetical protein